MHFWKGRHDSRGNGFKIMNPEGVASAVFSQQFHFELLLLDLIIPKRRKSSNSIA
jgi:hypothetical protein